MNSKINFLLQQADNCLILGHRNSEWCGHGPILEQDIAISNISLDLIGQARHFYQYAAVLKNDGSTEDSFAYHRDCADFKNILLVEQPKGDWAYTTLRQFIFSAWQKLLFDQLAAGADQQLSAIASKSLKEIAYHLRWSSEWVIRLGDGTDESRARIQKAINQVWHYTGEMFAVAGYEKELTTGGALSDLSQLKDPWLQTVNSVFNKATLVLPASSTVQAEGKEGKHSAYLEELLKEMQSVARAHPGAEW